MGEETKKMRQKTDTMKKRTELLENRMESFESWADEMTEHINRLQDQQLVQHVQLAAMMELAIEGRPVTRESLAARGRMIYDTLKQEATKDAIPEAESEGVDAATETMVASTPEIPT